MAGSFAFLTNLAVYCDRHEQEHLARAEREVKREQLNVRCRDLETAKLIGPDFRKSSFANSKADREAGSFEAWEKAREWRGGSNVFLYGPAETGKTYLAYCMMRRLFCGGASIAEVTARRFCKAAGFFDERKTPIEAWTNAQVLLFDDIDKCTWSEDRLDALWELLNTRKVRRRVTLITSNLSPEAISELFDKVAGQNSSKAGATLRRLKPCLNLHLHGKSYSQSEIQ